MAPPDPAFLTFDCYGTLVDWEGGILGTVEPLFRRHGVEPDPADVLRRYAELEAAAEEGAWRPYREVLRDVLEGLCALWGVPLEEADRYALADGLPDWPVFDDTVDALRRLKSRFGLAIVSNVDDDLFAGTARHLGVDFDHVVTAERAGAYKPSLRPFEVAFERLPCDRDRVLHVAQSLFHDHEPAWRLGLRSIRVNRPSRLPDRGLALPVDVEPEVEVPDVASVAERLGV